MSGKAVPVHLLLGQPGSGKDSRLALVAEETGASIFRFGAIFDRYASALPAPAEMAERSTFFAEYEVDGMLVDDAELLRRISSSGYLSGLNNEQKLWSFKIGYYGGFKTGLVPDSVVSTIFTMELTSHFRAERPESIVLNSYPKTVSQYDHLRRQLFSSQTAVPFIQGIAFLMEYTEWDVLEGRMANRLVCNSCDSVYAKSEVGDDSTCACGNELKQRLDRQIFDKRKEVFLEHTAPLIKTIQGEWSQATLTGRAHFDQQLGRCEIQAALNAWRSTR